MATRRVTRGKSGSSLVSSRGRYTGLNINDAIAVLNAQDTTRKSRSKKKPRIKPLYIAATAVVVVALSCGGVWVARFMNNAAETMFFSPEVTDKVAQKDSESFDELLNTPTTPPPDNGFVLSPKSIEEDFEEAETEAPSSTPAPRKTAAIKRPQTPEPTPEPTIEPIVPETVTEFNIEFFEPERDAPAPNGETQQAPASTPAPEHTPMPVYEPESEPDDFEMLPVDGADGAGESGVQDIAIPTPEVEPEETPPVQAPMQTPEPTYAPVSDEPIPEPEIEFDAPIGDTEAVEELPLDDMTDGFVVDDDALEWDEGQETEQEPEQTPAPPRADDIPVPEVTPDPEFDTPLPELTPEATPSPEPTLPPDPTPEASPAPEPEVTQSPEPGTSIPAPSTPAPTPAPPDSTESPGYPQQTYDPNNPYQTYDPNNPNISFNPEFPYVTYDPNYPYATPNLDDLMDFVVD